MDKSKKSCGCSTSERNEKESTSTLKIKWKRLISEGETCPRCGSTEQELRKAVSTLKKSFAPLGIRVFRNSRSVTI